MKEKYEEPCAFWAMLVIVAVAVCTLAGCQSPIERSDPASKSARATYGAISIVCSGDGSYCTFTLGDGAFTAADGEGATTSTASNDAAARLSAQVPGDAISAGISAAATVVGKGIDAYTATHNTADGSSKTGECADGSCKTGECAGGDCSYSADGECADGSCGD